jgi:WhiB family redox-sensing transcriptional regulator
MWQERSACLTTDPELFSSEASANVARAKRICAGCPVRAECLQFALDSTYVPYGIYGGLTPEERKALKRRAQHPEQQQPERWEPVPGYETAYQVSDYGRVRRWRGYVLRPARHPRGDLQVILYDGHGKGRAFLVGRLVLTVFDSKPLPGATVLYGPAGKGDCALSNLRWSRKPAAYWERTTGFDRRPRSKPRSTASHRKAPSERTEAS